MKVILAICLLFAAFFQNGFAAQCRTITDIDVSFCSMMVGTSVDSTFASPLWNGQDYFGYIDDTLQQIYNEIAKQVREVAASNGFVACDACLNQFKYLLCAGAFPSCGYIDCLINSFPVILNQFCPQACMCQSCTPLFSMNCTSNPLYNPNNVGSCDFVSMGQALMNNYANCNSHLLSRSHCETFANVCGCNPGNSAQICGNYFSPNGYTIPSWPTDTCSSTSGWCAATKKREDSSICPNKHICFSVPPPPVSVAATLNQNGSPEGGTVPSSTYTSAVSTPDNNNNNNGNSSSSFTIPSSVLLFLALIAALFF